MDTNEIMENEEVVGVVTEEIAKTGLRNGLKIGVGVGLTVLVGGIVYKFVAKPILAKIKSKKNQQMVDDEDFDCSETEDDED